MGIKFILAQVISGLSILVMVAGLIQKHKKYVLLSNAFSNICAIITYLLLDRFVAIFLVAGGLARVLIFAFFDIKTKRTKTIICSVFSIYFIFVTILLWQDTSDLLTLTNYTVMTLGFAFANSKNLKLLYAFSSMLLIPYNIIVLAYVQALKFAIQLVSSLIGYFLIIKSEKSQKVAAKPEVTMIQGDV